MLSMLYYFQYIVLGEYRKSMDMNMKCTCTSVHIYYIYIPFLIGFVWAIAEYGGGKSPRSVGVVSRRSWRVSASRFTFSKCHGSLFTAGYLGRTERTTCCCNSCCSRCCCAASASRRRRLSSEKCGNRNLHKSSFFYIVNKLLTQPVSGSDARRNISTSAVWAELHRTWCRKLCNMECCQRYIRLNVHYYWKRNRLIGLVFETARCIFLNTYTNTQSPETHS